MNMMDTKAGMNCSYRTESVLCCTEMCPALEIKFTLEQSHFRALPPEAFVSVNIISFCVMTQQYKSRVVISFCVMTQQYKSRVGLTSPTLPGAQTIRSVFGM